MIELSSADALLRRRLELIETGAIGRSALGWARSRRRFGLVGAGGFGFLFDAFVFVVFVCVRLRVSIRTFRL